MAEYIDREELKKAIDTWDRFYYVPLQGVKRGRNDDYTALVRIDDILHCIDNMGIKSTDVQFIKHGQWKYYKNNGIIDTYICTNCQGKVEMAIDVEPSEFKYCPKCGARMDGEQND